MVVHIYNPSHDEALAINKAQYCPSSAARRTGEKFWDIAKLWKRPKDVILHLPDDGSLRGVVAWCEEGQARPIADLDWNAVTAIEPWGWDRHIVGVLRKLGAPERLLPTVEQLDRIRELSSRQTAVHVLEALHSESLPAGVLAADSRWCTTEADVLAAIADFGHSAMLKQPWSCSGRGVWTSESPSSLQRIKKSLRDQGAVEVEPLYENLTDFAMEFEADSHGHVSYVGLSIFATHEGGGYAGNVVAPQVELRRRLEAKAARPLPLEPLAARLCTVLAAALAGDYRGPLGVDMMLTPADIHPCIEVNLRNTMGRVAIFQSYSSSSGTAYAMAL